MFSVNLHYQSAHFLTSLYLNDKRRLFVEIYVRTYNETCVC